jgi:hypothetical protein
LPIRGRLAFRQGWTHRVGEGTYTPALNRPATGGFKRVTARRRASLLGARLGRLKRRLDCGGHR